MRTRTFFLPAEAIRPDVAPGLGACVATDEITVHGHRVGYMYRDVPRSRADSGWHFFAGNESQAYVDEPDNMALYDVNTIANYDPEIIPFLGAPVRSAFERQPGGLGAFVPIKFPADPDDLGE